MVNDYMEIVKILEEYTVAVPVGSTHYLGALDSSPMFYKVIESEYGDKYFYWCDINERWNSYPNPIRIPALKKMKFSDKD